MATFEAIAKQTALTNRQLAEVVERIAARVGGVDDQVAKLKAIKPNLGQPAASLLTERRAMIELLEGVDAQLAALFGDSESPTNEDNESAKQDGETGDSEGEPEPKPDGEEEADESETADQPPTAPEEDTVLLPGAEVKVKPKRTRAKA